MIEEINKIIGYFKKIGITLLSCEKYKQHILEFIGTKASFMSLIKQNDFYDATILYYLEKTHMSSNYYTHNIFDVNLVNLCKKIDDFLLENDDNYRKLRNLNKL